MPGHGTLFLEGLGRDEHGQGRKDVDEGLLYSFSNSHGLVQLVTQRTFGVLRRQCTPQTQTQPIIDSHVRSGAAPARARVSRARARRAVASRRDGRMYMHPHIDMDSA